MQTQTHQQELALRIESMITTYMDEVRVAALRSVLKGSLRSSSPSRPRESSQARTQPQRRSAAELDAVVEKLYATLCSHPGETMQRLSSVMGVGAQLLSSPMGRLKRNHRVRSVGTRQFTRYFPMDVEASASPSISDN